MIEDHRRKLAALDELARRPGTIGEGEAARLAADRIRAKHQALLPLDISSADDPLVNLRIRLDRHCDRERSCCDNADVGIVTAGVGPHAHGLRCASCGRHRGWLKRSAGELLRRLLADGMLGPLLPTLKDTTILRGAMPGHPDAGARASPMAS
jgi:hypothetical protein